MHNSQGGEPMNWDDSATPNPVLLLGDCIGCHTGMNDGTNTTPYVFNLSPPPYGATGTEAGVAKTLAGGNFYWVAQSNDRAGHNVDGLAGVDAVLGLIPPGGDGVTFSNQLRCAGTLGCHGRFTGPDDADPTIAMLKSHHFKDHDQWQDGSTLATSYRFLYGIRGFGDAEYEYEPAASHHNKYSGVNRNNEGDVQAAGTISALCARCHGDYHGDSNTVEGVSWGSPWIRHPTNFDMSNATSSSEYLGYNGGTGTGNTYSVVSPVATADMTTTLNQTVTIASNSNNAIVMCISCHRAHGTPYDGILRWNYKTWPDDGGYNGCAVCHSTKN